MATLKDARRKYDEVAKRAAVARKKANGELPHEGTTEWWATEADRLDEMAQRYGQDLTDAFLAREDALANPEPF